MQQIQPAPQVSELLAPFSPVEQETLSGIIHQAIDDYLLTKLTERVAFIVPARAFENVNDVMLKYLMLVVAQLLRRRKDVALTDCRNMDFASDNLFSGRCFRTLTVADNFSQAGLASHA